MGVTKRGKSWQVEFYHDGKRYRKIIGTRKADAEEYFLEAKKAIRENRFDEFYFGADTSVMLSKGIEWYLGHYVDVNIPNERDRLGIARSLGYLLDHLGDRPMMIVRMADIESYKLERLKRVSKATVDRELGSISGLFNKLARYEIIPANPIKGKIVYYRATGKRARTASQDELTRILSTITNSELKMIVLIALLTGIRLGDICALTLSELDFEREVITFEQSKVRGRSKSAVNVIPMSEFLAAVLKRYIEVEEVTGRLFTLESLQVSTAWRGVVMTLGITPHIQFRDLRRSFATLLYNQTDADIKLVSELLGHSRIELSHQVYTKTGLRKKQDAVNSIDVRFLEKLF